jgi:hypothetical protein
MDATQIDEQQLIARYLSGRLPDGESDAFEQYLPGHPETCAEIEQTLRIKEGLARLRERGELEALLRAPAPRRWLPYAAAASVAFATLAALLWLQLRSPAAAMLFLSPSEVAARHHQPVAIRASSVLARTRGTASVTELTLPAEPGAIELKIVPSGLSNETRYRISLSPLRAAAGTAHPEQIDAGSVASDGYVTIYVDSSQLTPGDYEVRLTTAGSEASGTESDRFVIRLRSR